MNSRTGSALARARVCRKGDILIDMTFNCIFRQGLPGKCLYKSIKNTEMGRSTISLFFIAVIKAFSWKSLTENEVKGHIY